MKYFITLMHFICINIFKDNLKKEKKLRIFHVQLLLPLPYYRIAFDQIFRHKVLKDSML